MTDHLAEIRRISLPFAPVKTPRAKRIFDILVTAVISILLLPVFVCIILLFGIEYILSKSSRGPLLYSEIRISRGEPFQLYKFRIFKVLASNAYLKEHGFVQTKALEQDPNNLTFLGKILKKFYFDELPQLYNVLGGDMTLVGPRPSNVVVTWDDGKQGNFQRYLFTAGLTGPFQALKDSKHPPSQPHVDMEYILFCKTGPGRSIVLYDTRILVKSLFTVIRARGI